MKTGRPTDRIAEATPESRRFPANMSFNGKDDYRYQAESLPTPEAGTSRHGRLQLLELIDQLGERDFEILLSLKSAKHLLTGQVKRLHFTDASSDTAAMRAAVRAMRKLERYRNASDTIKKLMNQAIFEKFYISNGPEDEFGVKLTFKATY